MTIPIVSTKLFLPELRSKVVFRPRLVERLNDGLDRKLTLIAAPAGFGKTSLVCEWAGTCGLPVAWLSLDERDSDIQRFLAHLAAALKKAAEPVGTVVLRALQSANPPSPESALTALVNEVSVLSHKTVLVLDDYHITGSRRIDDMLRFLIEHLPPQLHLVAVTRENPQLPLGSLRARGHLNELRASDLRFTPVEAEAFLNQVMSLDLAADDIVALETRTEGWIAGLQLAALSMRGREDLPAFIRAFAGEHRYIMDYLAEEVLQQQPRDVREFLIRTSILERLHGPLCDAVTGQLGSSIRLKSLEQGNFFVVPLDDSGQWYRYHHLFAEVLRTHLKEGDAEPAMLHRRASSWYEQSDMSADAIAHALAAGDFTRTAELAERSLPAMRRARQEAAVLGWLKQLPSELIRLRPVLGVGYAWALLASGEFEAAMDKLREAEARLKTLPGGTGALGTVSEVIDFVDEEEFRSLPGSIAGYRAAHAQATGDISAAINYAKQVLELVPEDDHLRRGAAAALVGLASWTGGDLEAAYRLFAEGMAGVRLAGNVSDAVGGMIALADIRVAQGRLHQAQQVYDQGVQLAAGEDEPGLRGIADMYVGISELRLEQNDLQAAAEYLQRSKALGGRTGFPQNQYRWRVAMARIHQAQGNFEGALKLLHEAERLYVSDFFPNVRPVGAWIARVWVRQKRLAEALEWVRERGLSAGDSLDYLHEFEHITLARILLAHYQKDRTDHSLREGASLLERLLQAAELGGRTGSIIEVLILQALAYQMQGDSALPLCGCSVHLRWPNPKAMFVFLRRRAGRWLIFWN